ncbi:MAG: polymer-forming cytoskeletal protein [Chloroflexota bacterium]
MSFFGNRRQTTETAPEPISKKPELPQGIVAPQPAVGFETVLGANSALEGKLKSSANIRLDGTFTGTLEITGNVLVGETAKITADINARNISIAGAVRGNISGRKVQLLRTGRVWGDIHAAALTTEEGAFIDGKITMVPPEGAVPRPDEFDETESPVGLSQGQDYDRTPGDTTPVGMGATEEDTDDMFHEPGEPEATGPSESPLVENISQDNPEVNAVQTDSSEGQAYGGDSGPDDETKQST